MRSGTADEAYSELAAIVHVADILARALGAGWWGDGIMPRLDSSARHALRLGADDARLLLSKLDAAYPQAAATFMGVFAPRTVVVAHARVATAALSQA